MMQASSGGASHRHRRWRAGAAAATVALAGLGVVTPTAHAATPVTIQLVTVNDFHGRIERNGASAGAAALATAVKSIRAANPNTVFAAAGDLIGASTFTSFIANDKPTIDSLNAAGLEVSAVGNHEFDQGWNDLINRVVPSASWKYLGANVHTTDGTPNLPEYWTQTFQGVTIGFVGAVTDELPSLVSPAGIANLSITDPVTEANRVADQLSDGNAANGEADVVVLLVHEGAATTDVSSATDPNSKFGKIVLGADANIDAIVSGHTHLAYNHVINGRPVISSGQYGEKFSNMTIQVDPDTKQILSMVNVVENAPGTFADDPTVAAIVSAATAAAGPLGSVKVGDVTADFRRAKQPNLSENRGGESTIGNFVADVQLWSANQTGSAQIAFMNPGGIRNDLLFAPDGVITYAEAAGIQPFANTLITMDLTGAQVKTVLEQQWQPAAAVRPILHLGVNKELTFTYDPTAPSGSHITGVWLSGAPIDPAGTYRVVVNSFLAAGGDNFFELANGTNKTDTGKIDLQSMVDYFAANKVASPDYVQRGIGIDPVTPNAVGQALTVNVSSLDMSNPAEPKAGTATATLGGVSIGSTVVDPTPVVTTDEVGRGSFTYLVPPTVYGWQDFTVTVPSIGSTATQAIFLKATSTTRVEPDRRAIKAGRALELEVKLRSPIAVAGDFTVLLDGSPLQTFTWTPRRGEQEVKVVIPAGTTKGTHVVTVTYGGSATVLSSTTSFNLTVR
jgi:5'-nucleotidase